eukprot:m.629505 g.629505  ORF g.629505 m.629505 type:complete len:314 (-) comp58273_c0_seq23:1542-2483(-)
MSSFLQCVDELNSGPMNGSQAFARTEGQRFTILCSIWIGRLCCLGLRRQTEMTQARSLDLVLLALLLQAAAQIDRTLPADGWIKKTDLSHSCHRVCAEFQMGRCNPNATRLRNSLIVLEDHEICEDTTENFPFCCCKLVGCKLEDQVVGRLPCFTTPTASHLIRLSTPPHLLCEFEETDPVTDLNPFCPCDISKCGPSGWCETKLDCVDQKLELDHALCAAATKKGWLELRCNSYLGHCATRGYLGSFCGDDADCQEGLLCHAGGVAYACGDPNGPQDESPLEEPQDPSQPDESPPDKTRNGDPQDVNSREEL